MTEDIRAGCARLLPLFRHRDALKIQVSPLRKPQAQPSPRGKIADKGQQRVDDLI